MNSCRSKCRSLRSGFSYVRIFIFMVLVTLPGSFVEYSQVAGSAIRTLQHGRFPHEQRGISSPRELAASEDFLRNASRFFEVTKPISVMGDFRCTLLLLDYSFGNTINEPPVVTQYTPDTEKCGQQWSNVVLNWTVTSQGRQFDRIAAVWLRGVEIFRTCTAEPSSRGIIWTVEKEIVQYSALLRNSQELVVSLANLVDDTYTGLYSVTLSASFYSPSSRLDGQSASFTETPKPADVVLPVSELSPLNGGYWFQVQGQADARNRSLQLPRNVYKATLEVCVSFHGSDEFWYLSPPAVYAEANNLTGPATGPFREVVVGIDGKVAGAVWPFPVVYTGGLNLFFWRPAASIGAFDLPTYEIDITPFIGLLVDGNNHTFDMSVTNGFTVWLLGANLHLWVDPNMSETRGDLIYHAAPGCEPSLTVSEFNGGPDGSFQTDAARHISFSGYVESSFGNLTTSCYQSLNYTNTQDFQQNASVELILQATGANSQVTMQDAEKVIVYEKVRTTSFPFDFLAVQTAGTNVTVLDYNLTHAFLSQTETTPGSRLSLDNKQSATAFYGLDVNDTIVAGGGQLWQDYKWSRSSNGHLDCYERVVRVNSNLTNPYDRNSTSCIYVVS